MMRKALKPIVIILLSVFAAGVAYCVWYVITPHQVEFTDVYEQYACRDGHLISLKHNKDLGIKNVEISSNEYSAHYYKIDGIDENHFVVAWINQKAPLARGHSMVLQSPENTIDVLFDWDISKIELYYRKDSEKDINAGYTSFVLCEDDRHVLCSRTDEALFRELKSILNTENKSAFSADGYRRMRFEEMKTGQLHLRIWFEQSDAIVWDGDVEVFRSEVGEDVVVTVDNGAVDEKYNRSEFRIVVDPSTELYKMVSNAIARFE